MPFIILIRQNPAKSFYRKKRPYHTAEWTSVQQGGISPRVSRNPKGGTCEAHLLTFIVQGISSEIPGIALPFAIQEKLSSSSHLQRGESHLAVSKLLVWVAKSGLLFQIEAGFYSQIWAWQPSTDINRFAWFWFQKSDVNVYVNAKGEQDTWTEDAVKGKDTRKRWKRVIKGNISQFILFSLSSFSTWSIREHFKFLFSPASSLTVLLDYPPHSSQRILSRP